MRAHLRSGLLVGFLAIVAGTAGVGAQSSSPSTSATPSPSVAPPSPGASAGPADCSGAVGLLPHRLDDLRLDTTVTAGVAAIDPDELLDPLLASLGRGRADVCLVVFRYGDGPDAPAGEVLRIADVDVTDLGQRFVGALRERLVAYGAQAELASVQAGGHTVQTLDVTAEGERSQVVVFQLHDMLLLTAGIGAMDRLLPLVAPEPSPSSVSPTAPASPAG